MTKVFFALLVWFCFSPWAFSQDSISYRGRTIPLKDYIEGFEYKTFFYDLAQKRAYFLKKGDREILHRLDFTPGQRMDFSKAKPVSDVDFSKRNLWGVHVSKFNGKTYVRGDEDNTEIINLFELDETTGALKKITNVGYIYSVQVSEDGRYIAYSSRSGSQEYSPGALRVLDLKTHRDIAVFNDTFARRMTWSAVTWSPDQKHLIVNVVCDQDRTRQVLVRVSVAENAMPQDLMSCSVKRKVLPLRNFADATTLLYMSDESGRNVVYKARLSAAGVVGEPQALTSQAWNLSSAVLVKGRKARLFSIERKPITSVVRVLNPENGSIVEEQEFSEMYSFLSSDRERVMVSKSSAIVPYVVEFANLKQSFRSKRSVVDYGASLLSKIVQCDVEKVSFPTFDGVSAPGEKGTMHAFLYRPRNPATGPDARLLVEAFYGGVNSYSIKTHMFCNAGFYVLSPAPRGSWEWGQDFHNLMQGDLGGGEILDVFAAAKMFSAKLGIPAPQVGAFGGSHGGYSTLRLLTFPGQVNGVVENFKWGFGLSDFGISHIGRFFANTNIPGWVLDMTVEDPNKNPAKWLDRSPEMHAASAHGPIFMAHGSNDKRVGVEESQAMNAALVKAGKPVVYYEILGQGHGFKGTRVIMDYYQNLFRFLERIQ